MGYVQDLTVQLFPVMFWILAIAIGWFYFRWLIR